MQRMWRCLWILVGLFSMVNTCLASEGQAVAGSGVIITEKRLVGPFTSIDLSGSFTADVSIGEGQRIELKGDDNILPIIRTEVRDGCLHVYPAKPYSTGKGLTLTVSVPVLKGVRTSGANTVSVRKVNNESLVIDAGGASTFSVLGKAGKLTARLSGGSTLKADKLKAEYVTVDISGAGDAEVFATGKLDVNVSGVGVVRYRGNPEIFRRIMGVGDISPM